MPKNTEETDDGLIYRTNVHPVVSFTVGILLATAVCLVLHG